MNKSNFAVNVLTFLTLSVAPLLAGAADEPVTSNEFYASDKAAQFLYEKSHTPMFEDDVRINAGLFINEKRDNVITLGAVLDSNPSIFPSITLSVGARGYLGLLAVENEDLFALAAGVEASTAVLFEKLPLKFQGSFYYAPDVLTFGNSDRVIDWQVRAGLNVRPAIFAFVGVRFMQFDTRPGDRELDDQVHIGVRWDLSRK